MSSSQIGKLVFDTNSEPSLSTNVTLGPTVNWKTLCLNYKVPFWAELQILDLFHAETRAKH